MLKAFFFSTLLLITPVVAQECTTPEQATTILSQMSSNVVKKEVTGDQAKRVNEAIEATINISNPYEYDTIVVYTLTYQGSPRMFFAFFKNNCNTASLVFNETLVSSFAEKILDRGIQF